MEETKKVADKLIENAGYLFNKSHAISYSILAYWTSYFKAKYPAEFIEVLCNHSADDHDEIALCLSMARDLLDNPQVTLGNINNFSLDFKVTKDEFMVGLLGIKGLGKTVLNKIKNGMPSAGGWLDYTEFLQDNFQHKMISANDLKMLVSLGLFDDFSLCGQDYTRKALVDITDIYYNLFNLPKRDLKKICEKVFDDDSLTFKDLIRSDRLESLMKVFNIKLEDEYNENEIINNELKYVGFRVTENRERWEAMTSMVKDMGVTHISDFDDEAEGHDHVWLTVRTVEMLKTKKGKPYANVRADDGSSFRVWHNKLQYHTDDLIPGKVLIVKLNADTFGRSIAWDRGALVGEEKIIQLRQQL